MTEKQSTTVRKLWRDASSGADTFGAFEALFSPVAGGALAGVYCGMAVVIELSGYVHL